MLKFLDDLRWHLEGRRMKLRRITNISTGVVVIRLTNGNSINLPPSESIENIDVYDLTPISHLLSIQYSLNG
jgi:hypothetical protein